MLPDDILAAVFTKLLLVYGRRFSDAYAGQNLGTVKAHWQHELGSMPEWAVHHALEHLPPDHPPNVLQFKVICNTARAPMRAAIPPPSGRMTPAVREKLARVLAGLKGAHGDPLAGARSLRDKEQRGFHLTRVQREFWRAALKEHSDA